MTTISHELRTPLTAILGLAELTRNVSEDPLLTTNMDLITEQGLNLLSLIDEILIFVESDDADSKPSDVAVGDLLSLIASRHQRVADNRRIGLEVSLPKDPVRLATDQVRLGRVLECLTDNAIKFNSRGGHVEIGVRPIPSSMGDHIEFWVADDGPGIPQIKKHLLLQPMTRGDESDSRSTGGFGLGLASASEMVTRMGGLLEIDSSVGKGTRVHFTLPSNPRVEQSQAAPVVEVRRAKSTRAHVLVVDDSPVNRMVAQTALERAGFDVSLAEDGASALQMVDKHQYNVVLMDIQMPGMDGFEATRVIRQTIPESELPIVAVTAHALPGYRQKCLNAGMNDYVAKPYAIDELVRCVADAAGVPLSGNRSEADDHGGAEHPRGGGAGAPATAEDQLAAILAYVEGIASQIRDAGRIVRLYAGQLAEAETALADWLDEDSAAPPSLTIHSLKGSSLSCGASDLAASCVMAETSIAAGGPSSQAVMGLLERVRLLRVAVDRHLQAEDGQPGEQPGALLGSELIKLNDEEQGHLEALRRRLRASAYVSPDDVEKIASHTGGALRGELPAIEEAISSLDYQRALEILDALIARTGTA